MAGFHSLIRTFLMTTCILVLHCCTSIMVQASRLENGILLGFILAKKNPRYM